MPYSNKYIPGDWLVTCDICGFDYRFSDMRKGIAEGQKGLTVCPSDFDPVHPREKTPKLRPSTKRHFNTQSAATGDRLFYKANGAYKADGSIRAIGRTVD